MEKKTDKLLASLKKSQKFEKFYTENAEEFFTGDLTQLLNELVAKKGIKKVDAIVVAGLSEVYGYQVFCGIRRPERGKLIRLAIAMGADLEETQKLLKCAGYSPLYVRLPQDCVIIYGIIHEMSIEQILDLLSEYGQKPI